jgi:hypothetical protein
MRKTLSTTPLRPFSAIYISDIKDLHSTDELLLSHFVALKSRPIRLPLQNGRLVYEKADFVLEFNLATGCKGR